MPTTPTFKTAGETAQYNKTMSLMQSTNNQGNPVSATKTTAPTGGKTVTGGFNGTSYYSDGTTSNDAVNNSMVMPPNNVASTVSTANNYSKTPTSNPVITSKMAQDDFTSKLTAYQDLINQMNVTADVKGKQALQQKADQAQAEVGAASQKLESQKVAIQQQQADTDATTAQAKLQSIISQFGNKPGETTTGNVPTTTSTTGNVPTNTTGGAPTNTTGGFKPTDATNSYVAGVNEVQDERTTALNTFLQTSNNMIVGLQNSESALINATTQNFQNIMNAQAVANASQVGQALQYNARTGQEYSPIQAGSTLASVVAQGNMRLSEINSEMATTIAELQTSFAKEKYSMVNDQFAKLDKHFADRLETFKSVHDAVASDLKTQTEAAQKVKDNINSVVAELAKNGAPAEVIKAAGMATNEADAIQAGAGYFQDQTSPGGQYSAYVKATTAKGLTPMSAGDFINRQEYNKAYSSAAGKAAAELAASGNGIDPAEVIDSTSKSILAQTGLSMPAFQFMTQGTSALTRLSAVDRKKYMKEAEEFANKSGIDISTFKAQYNALSNTVEANLLRNNQAKVTENELVGTIENVKSAAEEANMTDFSKLNIAKIWAGKQLNSPEATTLKFHLEQLRKEYATYNAVLGGGLDQNGNVRALTPEDYKAADDVIQNGFANGSIDGFEKGLRNSTDKMSGVLENSVLAQNKAVWDLFGVGKNYDAVNLNPKKTVDTYIKSNPAQADTIAKMYEVPGATDKDIYEYLKANKLVK